MFLGVFLCACAIHSFINRENTILFSLCVSLNRSLSHCVCVFCVFIYLWPYTHTHTASSHHSFNIHLFFFFRTATNRQNVDEKEKNVKVEKKRTNIHELNVCTWCGPLRWLQQIQQKKNKIDHPIFHSVLFLSALRVSERNKRICSSLHNNAFFFFVCVWRNAAAAATAVDVYQELLHYFIESMFIFQIFDIEERTK